MKAIRSASRNGLVGILLLFSFSFVSAQSQISANFQILSRDFPDFNKDAVANANGFLLQVSNNTTFNNIPFELRLKISGNGIVIQSDEITSLTQHTIPSQSTKIFYSRDLAEYFDIENLVFSGFSKEDYIQQGGLPAGIYSICFETKASFSDAYYSPPSACAQFTILVNEVPLITYPKQNDVISLDKPYLFTWVPRHFATSMVEYIFEIYEDNGMNFNDLLLFTSPVWSTKSVTPYSLYNDGLKRLTVGQKYICVVKVQSAFGSTRFKNNGYSQPVTFTLASPKEKSLSSTDKRQASPECGLPHGTLFINEIANPLWGSNSGEYVEFVVAGTESTNGFVDLTGYIIDDNNFDEAEVGTESGHIRLSGECFNNVPVGTIILIYGTSNDGPIHPCISTSNDGMPNSLGFYQIPFDSPCLIKYPDCPDHQNDDTSYDCEAQSSSYGIWTHFIPMRNPKDVMQVRKPDYTLEHAVIWGTDHYEYYNSGRTIKFPLTTEAGGKHFVFDTGENWFDKDNFHDFVYGGSCANLTPFSPGLPNSAENEALINTLKNGTGSPPAVVINCSQIMNYNGVGAQINIEGSTGPYKIVHSFNNLSDSLVTVLNEVVFNNLSTGLHSFVVTDTVTGCSDFCDLIIEYNCEPGSPCNDFNNCTINDSLNQFCQCVGAPQFDIIFENQGGDSLCNYCTYYIYNCPGEWGLGKWKTLVQYIKLITPEGDTIVLDSTTQGLNFPYCYISPDGLPNGIPDCTGLPDAIDDLIPDINQWILDNDYLGTVEMGYSDYCQPLRGRGNGNRMENDTCGWHLLANQTNLQFVEIDMEWWTEYAGGNVNYDHYTTDFYGPNECQAGVGDSILATIDCPGHVSYLWSTGDTTAVIPIVPGACYAVTVTCDSIGCSYTAIFGEDCQCIVGSVCDDGNPCTGGGHYDENCNCVEYELPDSDNDGICDDEDACPGFDDNEDDNHNGIPDGCDHSAGCTDVLSIDIDTFGFGFCNYCIRLPEGDTMVEVINLTSSDNNYQIELKDICSTYSKNFENFESGSGIWVPGAMAARVDSSFFSNSPVYSMKIWDNEAQSQITTSVINMAKDFSAKIAFDFKTNGYINQGEYFSLYISRDNGNSFQFVKSWQHMIDFVDSVAYNAEVEIQGPFSNQTIFRIKSHANGTSKEVYIDNINIEGCKVENSSLPLIIEKWLLAQQFVGDAEIVNGNFPNCGGTGNHLFIHQTNIQFTSLTSHYNGSQQIIPFTSADCGQNIPGNFSYSLIAEVDCSNPNYLWNTNSTSDTLFVPSLAPTYSVTVTCANGCTYTTSVGNGDCVIGAPCSEGSCFNEDGHYDEYCNCIGSTMIVGADSDGDGIPNICDRCPCAEGFPDTDGDGVCDCKECPEPKVFFKYREDSTSLCDLIIPIYQAQDKYLTSLTVNGINEQNNPVFDFRYCWEFQALECESTQEIFGNQIVVRPSLKMFKSHFIHYLNGKGHKNFIFKDTVIGGRIHFLLKKTKLNSLVFTFENLQISSGIVPSSCKNYPNGNFYLSLVTPIIRTGDTLCTPSSYHWSNGETTDSILVPNQYTGYCVTVTCQDGCTFNACTKNSTCYFGEPCDDYNPCTIHDVFDANCNCIGKSVPDSDFDGVSDICDKCPGHNDNLDVDLDGIPDGCDDCGVIPSPPICDYCSAFPLPPNSRFIANLSFDITLNGQQVAGPLNAMIANNCIDFWGVDECLGGSKHILVLNLINQWMQSNGYLGHAAIVNAIPGQHPCCNTNTGTTNTSGTFGTSGSAIPGCLILQFSGTNLQLNSVSGSTGPFHQTFTFNEFNCVAGNAPELCDDGNQCTTNDHIDANCNCVGEFQDADHDWVCDAEDRCPGHPDYMDADQDGTPDGCDDILIYCDDGEAYPLCEYLKNRANCARENEALIMVNIRILQDSLREFFGQDPFNFNQDSIKHLYAPRLFEQLRNLSPDDDGDGIIDYLDPSPCVPNVSMMDNDLRLSQGQIAQFIANEVAFCDDLSACNNPSDVSAVINDGTRAQLLAKWMFAVQQDYDDINQTFPACATQLGLNLIVDADGLTVDAQNGCRYEFSVNCRCNCEYKLINDVDEDGICDSVDPVIGEECSPSACPEVYCKYAKVINCDCVYFDLPDADHDGVCDIYDDCPDMSDLIDVDNDGIKDCLDECIGGNMGVPNPEIPTPSGIGDPCDDGNPCTYADSINVNCNCEGILLDLDGDSISDCGDCIIYFDNPNTPPGDWLPVDPHGEFISCDSCYAAMSDTNFDGIPDKACDICPGLIDTIDYNTNGLPDCIDPPFRDIGCPVQFAFITDPDDGIMLRFEDPEITLDDLPNPIGVVLQTQGTSANGLKMYDYVPLSFTREVNGGFEVFYQLPNLPNLNQLLYASVSYASHQGCVLQGGDDMATVPCPSEVTIDGLGNLRMGITMPPGTNADILEFFGDYTLNLTSTIPGNDPINGTFTIEGSQISSSSSSSYALNFGQVVDNFQNFTNYSGTITLPNGVTCPYTSGSLDACPNGFPGIIGGPCNDQDTCTHHDRIVLENGACICKGDPKPDFDEDGLCDEIDPCPEVPNEATNPDNDGDGYPDCPCPTLVSAADSVATGGDYNIDFGPGNLDDFANFTALVTGGPDGDITFDSLGTTMPLALTNLPKGIPLTLRIKGIGTTGCVSEITKEISIPLEGNPLFCGINITPVDLRTFTLLDELKKEDVIKAADFDVTIREAKGSYGKFTGKGYIKIPYFEQIRINVNFNDIYISSNYQLIQGYINVNGYGIAVLGSPLSDDINDIINDIINVLDDISDILGELVPILETVEELVATTNNLVSEAAKNCVNEKKAELEALKLQAEQNPNDPLIIQAIKDKAAELKACIDDYNQELENIMNGLSDLIKVAIDDQGTLCESEISSLQLDYDDANENMQELFSQNAAPILNALGGNSSDKDYNVQDIIDSSTPREVYTPDANELSELNTFYAKINQFDYCQSMIRLKTTMSSLEDEKFPVEEIRILMQLFMSIGLELDEKILEDLRDEVNPNTIYTDNKAQITKLLKGIVLGSIYKNK